MLIFYNTLEVFIMKYKFETTPKKSKQMAKVHSKDGKDELIIRKRVWHEGIRYRTNYKELPGKPDIAITKYKIAVFIDGEFWQGYDWEHRKPRLKRNRDYWIKKTLYNRYLDDEKFKCLGNERVQTKTFPQGFSNNTYYYLVLAGG